MDKPAKYSEFCAADLDESNLFHTYHGVSERSRSVVKFLGSIKYKHYTSALAYLIRDWLEGIIGEGAPIEPWDVDAVRKVNKLNGDATGRTEDLDSHTKVVYDKLIEIKVIGHLQAVASHRRWICGTYILLVKVGVKFTEKMANLIWRHDLSKYSHKEVVGYAIMFGDGSIDFRQLNSDEEKNEWEVTLYNHYAHNPHHPEYYYPVQADGTRNREKSMKELDKEHGEVYLDESIIDMLASRGERYLREDKVFSIKKCFDIPDRFMGRYCPADRKYVDEKIKAWLSIAHEFMSVPENRKKVQGLFDDRPVVYDE